MTSDFFISIYFIPRRSIDTVTIMQSTIATQRCSSRSVRPVPRQGGVPPIRVLRHQQVSTTHQHI